MAAGDITLFDEFTNSYGQEIHDFVNDTFKLGLINNDSGEPANTTALPQWGNFSTDDVSNAGGYTAGGETIGSTVYNEADGTATFYGNNVSLSQNGSGFTNARWGIIYNDTAANDEAVGYVDLGEDISEQAGDININWNSNVIFNLAIS